MKKESRIGVYIQWREMSMQSLYISYRDQYHRYPLSRCRWDVERRVSYIHKIHIDMRIFNILHYRIACTS